MHNSQPKVHMGTLTGSEAREILAANPVILVPLGSHEDQGPHAPMGDYRLAEKIAELTAIRATERGVRTLVTPVIPFGAADWFATMPGAIAISAATLTAVLDDLVASLERHGLTRIIFINGHGGNVDSVTDVGRRLNHRSGIIAPSLYLWKISYGILPKILGPDLAKKVSGHGADPLTSLGLHLFPDLMRSDMIPEAKPLKRHPTLDLPFTTIGSIDFEGTEVSVPNDYSDVFNSGVSKGDPRLCSAETGAALAEELTEICARFVAHFAQKTAA